MKRLALIAPLLFAAPALAQQAPQPVTLSASEFQQIITTLARRDPVVDMLMQKQAQAQQGVSTPPSAAAAEPSDAPGSPAK